MWCFEHTGVLYRVIRNDFQGFNNLPPRSPDATPCDFFLWGYVKDQVYVPPLPASILELKVRIRTAIETITADMLQTVWNKLDYCVDVCRVVLLNKKIHILLSEVYCVWQAVTTPTIILNNPVLFVIPNVLLQDSLSTVQDNQPNRENNCYEPR
jgi:hypothetical protein